MGVFIKARREKSSDRIKRKDGRKRDLATCRSAYINLTIKRISATVVSANVVEIVSKTTPILLLLLVTTAIRPTTPVLWKEVSFEQIFGLAKNSYVKRFHQSSTRWPRYFDFIRYNRALKIML